MIVSFCSLAQVMTSVFSRGSGRIAPAGAELLRDDADERGEVGRRSR